MSISSALANANAGLSVASRRASLVSNNVANALTPGYSRRSVSVSENIVGGIGGGVSVDGITRASAPAVTSDRRFAESVLNRESAAATTYATFNASLGEPGDPFSLFAQFQGLETSLRSLSQTPESQPLQAQVLDAAKSLATGLNTLSTQVHTTRQNADAEIARQVDFVNTTLKQIENLNEEISAASAGGRDASALQDQRDQLIDEVSRIIAVKEVPRGNGKVDLMTNEGVFLIAGKAREIDFTPTSIITPDLTYAGGGLSGLSVSGTNITPGDGASSTQHGALAGLFKVRDDIAPSFQNQIDALARDVMERFEGVDPTLAPGAAGLFTDAGAAFDPLAELGLAGRIAVNAAVDPDQGGDLWKLRDGLGAAAEGPAGDATLLNALLDTFTSLRTPPPGTGLSGELSAADMAANITSAIGASRVNAETQLSATTARVQSLKDAESAAIGVDTDQELQRLLLIEQAFAANARVIQTADAMIQTLLEL